MEELKEYSFDVNVIIFAADENEATEIQREIINEIFNRDDVVQIYGEVISESNTTQSAF
jgi:hypothetical protein